MSRPVLKVVDKLQTNKSLYSFKIRKEKKVRFAKENVSLRSGSGKIRRIGNFRKNIFKELQKYIHDENLTRLRHHFHQVNFNVDSKNTRGDTLLHVAVKENNIGAVEFLLQQGASPDIKNVFD